MRNKWQPRLLKMGRLPVLGNLGAAASRLQRLVEGQITSTKAPADVMRDMMQRMGSLTKPVPAADLIPQGGQFISANCRNAAGSRDYKIYIPSTYHANGQAMPLVIMLHGCTQSPDDFAAGTRMNILGEKHGCLIAYPAQPASANPSKCWNWFSPNDQRRDLGEPSLIADITRQLMRDYRVDPRRIYIAGLSAGAAAAAIMGMNYPELYAAIGVHSGLACGAAHDMPSALNVMRQGSAAALAKPKRTVPAIIFHGDRDTTVNPRNGDQVMTQSAAAAPRLRETTEHGQDPGGHAYDRTRYADDAGKVLFEKWFIHGAAHAWSSGSPAGSFTDPMGPDASSEMLRFFLEQTQSQ